MSEADVHEGQHTGCGPCFQIKIQSIQFQGVGASERRQTGHSRDLDMDAYKAMRRQGVQPKNVFGSHEIAEKAGSTFEAEHGVIMAPNIRKEMESRMAATKEILGS